MGIKKLPDGRLRVSYSKKHPATRKTVTLTRIAETSAEAKRLRDILIQEVMQKIAEKIAPSWESLVVDYLQDCCNRGLGDKTIYNTDKCLKAATLDLWGKRLVDRITTQEIRDLIYKKYGDKSPSHQKTLLKYIRQAFQFGVERGDINRNPTPKLAFKVGDKIKKVLTEEQVRIFLNKAREIDWEWYPHCTLAVYTGMRNGELYALTWDKVNFEGRQICVDSAWNNKAGFKDTKSGHERIVEIAPNLLPVLKELKLACPDSHFVLPRSREWDCGDQARHLRKFLMSFGLPAIRFHDLRATWATIMLSKGVPPIQVMKMGGWKDMKTMMIYSRMAGIDIKGITDILNLHNPSRTAGKVLDFSARSS